MLLRRTSFASTQYLVVGQAYVSGAMDGESILGPLPINWTIKMLPGADGRQVTCFHDRESNTLTRHDPRLPALAPEWERVPQRPRLRDDPYFFQDYRNRVTGEVVNADPRVGWEALVSRGVGVERFCLV